MRRILVVMLALMLAGCYSSELENTSWELVEMDGQPAYYPATLEFDGPRTFSGDAGCNSYDGTYTVKAGGGLTTSNVMISLVACPNHMQDESIYVGFIRGAVQYTLAQDSLIIGTPTNPSALIFNRTDE